MELSESVEMYLETILVLNQRQKEVRAVDIASKMGFSKPAVSRALNRLKAGSLIETDGRGWISLTDKGRMIAASLMHRRHVLTQLLVRLGVDEQTASEDACRMEHQISGRSFEAIENHLKEHAPEAFDPRL